MWKWKIHKEQCSVYTRGRSDPVFFAWFQGPFVRKRNKKRLMFNSLDLVEFLPKGFFGPALDPVELPKCSGIARNPEFCCCMSVLLTCLCAAGDGGQIFFKLSLDLSHSSNFFFLVNSEKIVCKPFFVSSTLVYWRSRHPYFLVLFRFFKPFVLCLEWWFTIINLI